MPSLQELLAALNAPNLPTLPAPANPLPLGPLAPPNVPQFGGPSRVTEPPTAPFNASLIPQYQQFAGPPPTPPPAPSRLQQIGGILGGISAGLQGRGPEYTSYLQEPQRRYKAQVENYNNRRASLGLAGFEAARADQAQTTRRA